MNSRKALVFACETLAVALIAGGSSFAYADKGGNKHNPNDIAAIHTIIPKIENPGRGYGPTGVNMSVPATMATGRPTTPNSPTTTLPAVSNSAANVRKNSDSPALTPSAAALGSKRSQEGKDDAGKDRGGSRGTEASDRSGKEDKNNAGKNERDSENAAALSEQEVKRIDRLPSCT